MNVPPWAGFVADFPDDQIESAGDIDVFGGCNVAIALGEILTGLGCSRISDPESAGDQGWEFDFYYEGRHRFWCRVQSFHPVFWLLFEDVSGTKKGAAAYVELWRKFGNALERDPRFHKILWRPFKEGPPDWDEVEATADPPERTFEEQFPASDIKPKKPGFGCWPLVIWIWFALSGLGSLVVGLTSSPGKERSEDIGIGIVMLVLCSTPVLLMLLGLVTPLLARASGKQETAPETQPSPPLALRQKPPGRARLLLGSCSTVLGLMAVLVGNVLSDQKQQVTLISIGVAVTIIGLALVLARKGVRATGEPPTQTPEE
jgi:hypothetical protein